MILLEALLVVLVADFVSGLLHWAEDTFADERTPLIGRWVVTPNVLHHKDGRAFVGKSWLASSWDLAAIGLVVLGAAWSLDLLTWHVGLFVLVGSNANQIHKWSHMSRREAPLLVRVLQRAHVLQSPAHHAGHHRGEKNRRYCVVTELVNPVLDGLGFWRGLELMIPARWTPRRADLQRRRAAA